VIKTIVSLVVQLIVKLELSTDCKLKTILFL